MLRNATPLALLASAEASLLLADVDAASAQAQQAMALALALGDRVMQARAATLGARVFLVRDESEESMAMALRAIDLCRAIGDRATLAKAHGVAARVLLRIGDTDAALTECMAALEASEGSNDPEALGAPMRELANVYGHLRQWDKALEFADAYCETARQLGNRATESAAIDTVAWIYGAMREEAVERGDMVAADRHANESECRSRVAMTMAREAGSYIGEGTCMANLAESLSDLGRHAEALAMLDDWPGDAARMTLTLRSHHDHTRGIVLTRLGRHREAIELLSRCVVDAPSRPLEITALRALTEVLENAGDLRAALRHHKRLSVLVSEQSSERARRAASVAAVRLETATAHARASLYEAQASDLARVNAQLNLRSRDLQRLALEDPLTGLPNRRRLDELLSVAAHGYSMVMIDVDHFKRVNDEHSHLVGDAVLCELAALLRSNCRHRDVAVRFGGEEFMLLLHDVTVDGAVAAAERTRAGIESHAWATLSPGLAVTASFGIASGSEAEGSLGLLALADQRMYAAKAGGRNRVVGPP